MSWQELSQEQAGTEACQAALQGGANTVLNGKHRSGELEAASYHTDPSLLCTEKRADKRLTVRSLKYYKKYV